MYCGLLILKPGLLFGSHVNFSHYCQVFSDVVKQVESQMLSLKILEACQQVGRFFSQASNVFC